MLASLEDNNWYGRRLKFAREAARLSQEELAERVDLTRLTIARYESGKLKPSFERLVPIAAALSQPLWWFFTDRDNASVASEPGLDTTLQEIVDRLNHLESQVGQCQSLLYELRESSGSDEERTEKPSARDSAFSE